MRIKLNTYIVCIAIFLCSSIECIYSQKLKWNFGLSRRQSYYKKVKCGKI